jgi:hypothetical protein
VSNKTKRSPHKDRRGLFGIVEKDSEKMSASSAPPGWAADPMRFYGSGDAGAEASE